jgi:hypothetical protein
MIEPGKKKIILISIWSIFILIITTLSYFIFIKQPQIKKHDEVKRNRIEQENFAQFQKETAEIEISQNTEEQPTITQTPQVTTTQTTKPVASSSTTTTTPTNTIIPETNPTPVIDTTALIITAKYDLTNIVPEQLTTGSMSGYYLVDPLNTDIRLDFARPDGTHLVATIEEGGYWFVQISETKYKFIEGGSGVVRIDLLDADNNIVKTGKCKLTTPRG